MGLVMCLDGYVHGKNEIGVILYMVDMRRNGCGEHGMDSWKIETESATCSRRAMHIKSS